MNHDEEHELRHLAEQQVDAFIEIIQRRYGISEEEIPLLLGGIRWANNHKARIEGSSIKALYTVVVMIVTGVSITLWEGIKLLARK